MKLTRRHFYDLFLFMAFIASKEKNTGLIVLITDVSTNTKTGSLDVKVADLLAKMTF